MYDKNLLNIPLFLERCNTIEENVSCYLILRAYWLSVGLVPHRHLLREVAVAVIALFLGAGTRKKKGVGTTQKFCECLTQSEPGEGSDVRIRGSASECGR